MKCPFPCRGSGVYWNFIGTWAVDRNFIGPVLRTGAMVLGIAGVRVISRVGIGALPRVIGGRSGLDRG